LSVVTDTQKALQEKYHEYIHMYILFISVNKH